MKQTELVKIDLSVFIILCLTQRGCSRRSNSNRGVIKEDVGGVIKESTAGNCADIFCQRTRYCSKMKRKKMHQRHLKLEPRLNSSSLFVFKYESLGVSGIKTESK